MKLINDEVRIETTNLCNAHCSICPREKMTRPKTTMGMEHFKFLVDQCKDLGAKTVSLFGYGEPLMDKDLETKIRYCTDLGLETFITTNCDILDLTRIHNVLKAGLSHIRFSVHGIWDREYESVHNGKSFKDVMRNVGNFIILNKKVYGGKCKTSASVIPMNGETVEQIRALWDDKTDWLEIWKPHNWANGKDYRNLTTLRKKTCGRPFSGPVQINADGRMMVCCMDFDASLTVGDTHESTIEEILKGDRFNEIRRKHSSGDLTGLICNECDQLNIGDKPLLYSSRDPKKQINITSSTKFKMEELKNGTNCD